MLAEGPLFNLQPWVQRLEFGDGRICLVVDDALREPEHLRQIAVQRRDEFVHAPYNAYPGIELPIAGDLPRQLDEFFARHVRAQLGGRRTLKMNCRLAMATTPPRRLQPRQWICHRDSAWVDPLQAISASVLYLFDDASLGGTSFYAPRIPANEVDQLVHDSGTMDAAEFSARRGLQASYMDASNAYFERVGRVPAKWNRIIFYDGRMFHSGEIGGPAALTGDPMTGRLTLNGFFTCRRSAS